MILAAQLLLVDGAQPAASAGEQWSLILGFQGCSIHMTKNIGEQAGPLVLLDERCSGGKPPEATC